MPSLEHNGLVEMFRENPALAPHLLAIVFHADVPPHASVRVADSGLDQLVPLEFRADLVLELLDEMGMAHGNGAEGLAVLQAALVALERLDREHGAVYFHIIWSMLREPMQRALEAKVMKEQAKDETKLLPWMERFIELGEAKGKAEGKAEGEAKGKRDALLRLLARLGIELTEDERSRILSCTDSAVLDRWLDNVLGAKTAADVLS